MRKSEICGAVSTRQQSVCREILIFDSKFSIYLTNADIFTVKGYFRFRNISILVTAKKAGDVELDVAYQVRSASWTPMYDIRAQTAEKTLEVSIR